MKYPCTEIDFQAAFTRREILSRFGMGLGAIGLSNLLSTATTHAGTGILPYPHHEPRTKRVIFLFQAGAPSQIDLLDYKPVLNEKHGTELPAEVRGSQRLTGMSGNQSSLPLAGSPFKFRQHGESGAWISE